MHFTSITSMSGNIFILPKINVWTTWWSCLPGVSNQRIVIFHSIYYLLIEKHFSEVRNASHPFSYGFHQHLNYWCKHHIFITKNQLWVEWWCLVSVSNQSIVIFNFCMLLLNETSFFRSQIDLKLIYLWALGPLDIWLVIYFYQKDTCTVNGVVCFMFQANLLLYSLFNMFLMTVKSSFRS